MMIVDLYIDSNDIAKYNEGQEINAETEEKGYTTTTRVHVPACEVKTIGTRLVIKKAQRSPHEE